MPDLVRVLADMAKADPRTVRGLVATVSAVREDGRVNLAVYGELLEGVACATSYTGRATGDVVVVQRLQGVWTVAYRVGGEPDQPASLAPPVADITVGDTAPGAGWTAGQVWFAPGAGGRMRLFLQKDTAAVVAPAPLGEARIGWSDAGSWQRSSRAEHHPEPTQGNYVGDPDYTGAWFYGNALTQATAGKPVAQVVLRMARATRGGVFSGVRPRVYLHGHPTAPSRTPVLLDGPWDFPALEVGQAKESPIPAEFVSSLASGAAKGFAIYANGPSAYLVCAPSAGTVRVTYT